MTTHTHTKRHSEAVRKAIAVETANLQKRCMRITSAMPEAGVMVNLSEAIKGVAPKITAPADADRMTEIMDRLIPLEFCARIAEETLKAHGHAPETITLAADLDEMIGYHSALIREMASSLRQEPPAELSDTLLEVRILYGISSLRANLKRKPSEKEALNELSRHILKDDPAYRYLLSSKTIPYRIYKWLIEERIPGTESVVAICKDYGARWRAVEARMDAARENNIVDDYTWNEMWRINDKLIEDWKAAVKILTERVR